MVRDVYLGLILRLSEAFGWAPDWLTGGAILVLLAGAALLLGSLLVSVAIWASRHRRPLVKALIARCRGPARVLLVVVATLPAVPAVGLPASATDVVEHALLVVFVLMLGWAAVIATGLASDRYLRRFSLDVADNLVARKHVTQVRILRRTADTLVAVVTVAAAFMTIPAVRTYGVSLFASAGAAGLVVGLAARPLLSNLIAGIQIAVTQPIRMDDAVIVEGEYGWIEDITSTFIVVRLWDLRRMILPLSYFIERPFQNWTYQSSALIGTVFLNVDYAVPVDALRTELERVARASVLWDGKTVALQVTDSTERTIQLRALVSAADASAAWDLRCEVREKLVAWLQLHHPESLPRLRVEGGVSPAEQPDVDVVPAVAAREGAGDSEGAEARVG